ncbi:hypothetical protein [Nocardioides sp.]|uniref:hypothetical protein n=1 Tax=Nocardioides sp. TaxID=35761 RepID=UPI0035287A4E
MTGDTVGADDDWPAAGPEAMRDRLADYVGALHRAYLGQAELLAPAERAAMPLVGAAQVTVAVAATRELHLVATTDPLPPPRGPEVEIGDHEAGVSWTVRFFDATILPELGLLAAEDPPAVRRVLGIAEVVYHLSVSPGGGLSGHHAQHAGVALANRHAAAVRDGQAIRHAFPGREALVDEFVVAERVGLRHAARLLAAEIAPSLSAAELAGDAEELRRALLTAGRSRR